MRWRASNRFILAALGVLALSSLGLKAAAGPPRDGLMDLSSSEVDGQLAAVLRAARFTIAEQTFAHRSTLLLATRSDCRLAVRDARDGAAVAIAFARDAAEIGPVRYLYRGRTYDQPPAFAMRLGRIQAELMDRLGIARQAPVPVALAASPQCGGGDFGLGDVRI
jgi:hypothetical protein